MPAIWIPDDQCYSGNAYLTETQMQANAIRFYDLCSEQNWTISAVCGMLGNAEVESSCNPGIWQGLDEGDLNGGYGFFQWTPASKYINWCNSAGYNREWLSPIIPRLLYERDNADERQYFPTSNYPETFNQFMSYSGETEDDVKYLARAWCYNYERPASPDVEQRENDAVKWYTFLKDSPPPAFKGRKMKLIYYLKKGGF